MNKKAFASLYCLVLITDLVCVQLQLDNFRFVTKPLIVLSLLVYFIWSVQSNQGSLKGWVASALVLSWLGDVLLLFESQDPVFFILGLSSFLLAHVCYSYFFNKVRQRERVKGTVFYSLFVIIYYSVLMQLLTPGLGSMALPVWVYGVVICTMLWLALHLYSVNHESIGLLLLVGALLFVLSDSVLAINKFYKPFTGAGLIVMLTYGLAQWFIAEGSIRWLHGQQKKSVTPVITENKTEIV